MRPRGKAGSPMVSVRCIENDIQWPHVHEMKPPFMIVAAFIEVSMTVGNVGRRTRDDEETEHACYA